MISIFEMRAILPEAKVQRGRGMSRAKLYGLMAEFENPTALVEATRHAREEGFTKLDAYSPYPIEALTEALDIHDRKLPAVVLGGGILGGLRRLRALLLDARSSSTR